MSRNTKIRTAIAALAVSLAAVTGVASAAGAAETKVTIKGQNGDFYGYVKSSDPEHCAEGRKVTLFKQEGSKQDPKNDTKVASDTASLNGDKAMWSTGNTGLKKGNFYARAARIPGCKADTSKTISS